MSQDQQLTNYKLSSELEGQNNFYETYLPRVDNSLTEDDIKNNYNDGVVNGNILEFKNQISNLNAVLFQAIKYLSSMRVKGIPVPSTILLISLINKVCYVYNSVDYLTDIEKIYTGAASKDNSGFTCYPAIKELHYDNAKDEEEMISILKKKEFTKINIDENCIVGWAKRFYKENPGARKADFIGDYSSKIRIVGEIRRPNILSQYIIPYKGRTNKQFRYLMDKLNDEINKKNLGAFYTPELYVKKSLELVRLAIERVPKGNDYVIIDRCAGTGNLESCMTTEELSHVIVSTLEYYEYKVLIETLGDKVRHIIPPTEREDTFNLGLVRGADALTKEYINNEIINEYINNPKCTIIFFENPPYVETTSIEHQRKNKSKKSGNWKRSFAVKEMKKEVSKRNLTPTVTNDMGNVFIWSAFHYYLRQPTDSYILYSPAKYWKAQHLISKRLIKGFAFNRKHFHTNINACIMCLLWSNENAFLDTFEIDAYNIKNDELVFENKLTISQIKNGYSSVYFDKRKLTGDVSDNILCGLNGLPYNGKLRRVKPIYNNNIIGYLAVYSSGFDNPDLHSSLLSAGRYDGNGFYLRSDNYLEKLPMFAASRYIKYNKNWTERGRIMKSADGHLKFQSDVANGSINQFLLKCLLFTIFEPQNHMREFLGENGRIYHNHLCLDNNNGKTLASKALKKLRKNKNEKELIKQWEKVLYDAKQTKNYNPKYNYGLYQIIEELNTYTKDEISNQKIYDYPSLNGNIRSLAEMVKNYYLNEIVPILFKYEFIK